jgi:SAM-dependent methyltransferase
MSPERPVVHTSAAVGFERAAAAYERGRPAFPPIAVASLIAELDLRPGRNLLELGAGTGKLTRLLAPSGARIVAVEPVAAMRARLVETARSVDIVDAVAEAIPLADESIDAAAAAQAFHWFDADQALGELARVLVPGARLALVWNIRDESAGWVRALTELIEPYRGDAPSHRSMRWLDAFDRTGIFERPQRTSFPYEHRTTRDQMVDRVLSISFVATLDDKTRDELAVKARALAPGNELVFPYRTDVWLTTRR